MRRVVISVFLVFLIGLGSLATSLVAGQVTPPVSLDGSAKNGCGYVTSCSVSLTTAHGSDVIIVTCNCWPAGGPFSVKDTAGLTYIQRTAQLPIGGNEFIQEWYAIAPSPLTGDSISIQTSLTGETWYGVIAFGVSGANTASPFDTNPSLPRAQANIACPGGDPCNTGISTNGADFVFQLGGDTGSGTQTVGTGFTLIQSNSAGQDVYAQYEVTSSPLSSATLAFGAHRSSDFGVITDALQPSSSTTSSSSTSSTTSSTTTSSVPPSLDGSAKNGCGYVTSCSVSLTTTHASDVIIVGCDCLPAGTSFSVKDTAGLTFIQRTNPLGIGGNQFLQTWYAIAPSALTGDVISVQTSLTGKTWYGIVVFGVSGANTASPFDTNPSLPRAQANIACPGGDPCNTGVSAAMDDLVFQFGGDTGSGAETAGSGFNLIQSNVAGQDAYAQYKIASSPLSSATLSFGTPRSSDFGMITDALQPPTSSSLHSTSTSVTPNPVSVTGGSVRTFTTAVTDTSASPTTPTGAISWNDGGAGGSFSGSAQCTLSSTGSSSAACSTTYTAPSTLGPLTITATYAGDSTHSGSSGRSMVTVASSSGSDWSSFTLDSVDSRYQSNSSITSSNVGQITQKWVISTQGSVTSTPIVLGGNVYFADWGGNVYSAVAATGHINWKVNLGSTSISSTLGLSNGMVYVGDGLGQTNLFALSQTDGHVIWETHLISTMNAVWASPIVVNGLVYIGVASNGTETIASWRGEIYAVNATTGSVVWTFNTSPGSAGGAGVWGSVVYDPQLNSIYFGTSNSYGGSTSALYSYSILSLNAKTGSLNWYYQTYTSLGTGGDLDFGSTPNLFSISVNGVIHSAVGLGSKDGYYYIVDRMTGTLLEKVLIGTGGSDGGIVGVAGFINLGPNNPEVFIPSHNEQIGGEYGVLKALTPSNGTVRWQFNTPVTLLGSVAIIPGAVLFGDTDGNLYAVSTGSGHQLFHATVPGSIEGGISVAEGLVFVPMSFGSENSGGLYAFG